MIFVGDIALPFPFAVKIKNLPQGLQDKNWIGNLEGAIVKDPKDLQNKSIVYNHADAIKNLTRYLNFSGFTLANNHIFDAGSYNQTVDFLKDIKIPYCGIGKNLAKANEPLILQEEGQKVVILNFGWEVIQCKITTGNFPGVNPLRKDHVLTQVTRIVTKYPDANVVAVMHWNYELEAEPQPSERELAKKLIDLGLAGVIGCHSHRVGGFEIYKGKPIIYSLGNWMFTQKFYNKQKSQFPDFCNLQLAFEWNFDTRELVFHFFKYDRKTSIVTYSHTEKNESSTLNKLTPFKNLTNEAFKKWYKTNHYHKKKGLPIYYFDDSNLLIRIKNTINRFRDFAVLIRRYIPLRSSSR